MKRSMKILVCLLMAVLCAGALAGCRFSKGEVRLKGESSLKKYAKENCPDCTFMRFEKEEDKHIAYFVDDKCGFEFSVSSEVTTVHFDGAKRQPIHMSRKGNKAPSPQTVLSAISP